ncbi:guanylate kinase [Asticcacaulis biprosthecium C19]|uniref:Guanylate kinase n=1 Tax=Asticcacaulis biprosthecium C19 TaxID=715226 RepID=F4QRD6_9CAUL|nr:guanylate kinase [Asticcacaulis biprosthecium]EGF90773.1 guanylate kinase [Asticcacaulis biprosthecium C19]
MDKLRRGLMMIVAAPSGAGKTSLCRRLVSDHADLDLSISVTTRGVRPGEKDGRDYHFIKQEEMDKLIADKALLEYASVHDAMYGSPRDPVEKALSHGRNVLFDIDWQGAQRISARAPGDVVRVFILPPSMAELNRRLVARAQDDDDVIQRRISRAKNEISHWAEYDYIILNDDFDRSYAELVHIYHAEASRRARGLWISPFVDELMAEKI